MIEWAVVVAVSFLPWVELRGAIPLGVAMGLSPLWTWILAVAANCLIIFPTFIILDLFYTRWLGKIAWIQNTVGRIRRKGEGYIARYELLGLALFVAIPLPGTGAYAGTVLAWLLGLPRRKSGLVIACGVAVAGVLVTLGVTGTVRLLRLF
ncbi:MAG: small multi-drug export protein [Armatimonadota bacterium]|nr:small multi-drug export protein [Armatimonadota bacterium]